MPVTRLAIISGQLILTARNEHNHPATLIANRVSADGVFLIKSIAFNLSLLHGGLE